MAVFRFGDYMSVEIIAEIGVNHDGDIRVAKDLIDGAIASGADTVKFQTFDVRALASQSTPKVAYQTRSGEGETHFEMLEKLQLSKGEQKDLARYSADHGASFLSTPYDPESLAFLAHELGLTRVKIASADLCDFRLHKLVIDLDLEVIISSGMSTFQEIDNVLDVYGKNNFREDKITLLQCTSAYPVEDVDVHLAVISELYRRYHLQTGFSDHSRGGIAAIGAVALGATVIERHITYNRCANGPDHFCSSELGEFGLYCADIRSVERMMGNAEKKVLDCEKDMAQISKKSWHYEANFAVGHSISETDIVYIRPNNGCGLTEIGSFIGKPIVRSVNQGDPVLPSDFAVDEIN